MTIASVLSNPWFDYPAGAHKLLSDNRDRYIAQSAATRNGEVATLPARGPASLTLSPEGGDSGFHPDPPDADEVIAAGNWHYGLAQESF